MGKKSVKRCVIGLLILGLLSGVLASCSSAGSGEDENAERSVSAMVMQSRNYPGLEKMIAKLKEEENITVDLQVIPDEQYDNLLKMKLGSGECPDMIDYSVPQLYGLIDPTEYLADLTDEEWTSRLINPALSTYDDGKIYSFTFKSSNGNQGMIYNKSVFDENGIEIPKTQEEFDRACETLIAAGITPILLASDPWVPQIWMASGYSRAFGTDEKCQEFADAILSNEKQLTDYPELQAALNNYFSNFTNNYFNEDYLTVSYDSCLDRLANGEGAMLYGTSSMVASIEGTFPDVSIGMFNLPVDYVTEDVMSATLNSIGFSLYKDSKNADTVKEIFELWSTPAYCDLWFEGNAGFPAFEGVDGGEINEEVLDLYNEYQDTGKLIGEMNAYLNDLQPLFSSSLWVYYLEAPSKGNMDAEALLERFQEDINKYMKEKQAPGF
ncbi:MAG: ABC transporter substrate-binding protein [Lachnospiraceae bacterium]